MSETIQIPRIKKLSSSVANQIAAGEVIERPASVIKELLENSLDAGARRIVIDIQKAGSQLIRVNDDGHGIHPQDLKLAMERHATGKLNDQSDLALIQSLGFRGEALPSISSVAELTLTSRINGMETASSLSFDPLSGESEMKPAAHAVGTTVEVRNLFHNTPARKKFLRSDRTEFLHIQEMVRRLALSCSDVSIELRHNDQGVLKCRDFPDKPEERVASLLGRVFIQKAIALNYVVSDMRIQGWLGVGDLGRSSTDRQYLYLNGRMIRDKQLNHAIRLACEGQLAEGRFPSYVLYLSLNLAEADVNVHPTKHEVRFRHARDVHDFLFAALSTSLSKDQSLYPDSEPGSTQEDSPVSAFQKDPHYQPRHNIVGDIRASYGEIYSKRQTDLIGESPLLGVPILQIEAKYILAQREDVHLLINIEAAKKHIAEVKLNANEAVELTSRPLLVPIGFAISEAQEKTLTAINPALNEYAIRLQLAGPGNCMLRELPSLLENADFQLLVNDLLNLDSSDVMTEANRESLKRIMIKHVCDISTPNMSTDEMTSLLRQLEHHGLDVNLSRYAPIWTTLNTAELDKLMQSND